MMDKTNIKLRNIITEVLKITNDINGSLSIKEDNLNDWIKILKVSNKKYKK
jgi:hypothetical protein